MGSLAGMGVEPLPTLPSSYSVHDFHMYGIHGTGITPGTVVLFMFFSFGNSILNVIEFGFYVNNCIY